MQEAGSRQQSTPSVITHPIDSHQNSTSVQASTPEPVSFAKKELPTPDTLEAYLTVRKQPYALEYLKIQDASNLPTYKGWAEAIDEYVRGEMEKSSYTDTLKNYKHIFESLAKSVGLDERMDGMTRLRRMALVIKDVLLPMQKLEKRKQTILYGGYSQPTH